MTSQSAANTTVIASQHPLETSTGRGRVKAVRNKHGMRDCRCKRRHARLTGKQKRRKKELEEVEEVS